MRRLHSILASTLALIALAGCASTSDDPGVDTARAARRAALPNPAWAILLDHHQGTYPDSWAYVFASGSLESCREQNSYEERRLKALPKSQFGGQDIEAVLLINPRDSKPRPGRIVRLEKK